MKLYKKLLVVALAAMPAAALQAQTYNDTVRTNTWTLYGAGGVSGYHGFRGGSDTGVHQTVAPDFSVGVKYNIKPWARVGFNLGYTKIKAMNNGLAHTQTITNNFQIGDRTDGVLTTDKVILSNRNDIHLAGADLNADFNILELFQQRNQHWNLWFGTGVGYLHGWNRSTLTTAVSEEGISKGDDHFNVYNHDYITTESANTHINTLYIPVRLSLEYDITPRWTVGVKGEYKFMPLDVDLTPKGIWSVNASIAYNFGGKRARKPAVDCSAIVARMNEEIAALKASQTADKDEMARLKRDLASKAVLEKELAEAKAELDKPHTSNVVYVFYELNKSQISKEQVKVVGVIAQLMNANPNAKAYIKGYASPEGSADHNNELASQRAKAVADMLTNDYNIAADRIITEGCGVTDSLNKVLALNRVAVITVEN